MLVGGVKIYSSNGNGIEIEQQVELNDGLMYANVDEYAPKALIPSISWRSPSSDEYKKLSCLDEDGPPHSTIGLIDLPKSCFQKLQESGFYNLETAEDLALTKEKLDYSELTAPIVNYLDQNFKIFGEISTLPLSSKSPGQPTVSSYYVEGKKIWVGLHVDTWERKDINELNRSRNFICINLGKEIRFFIFLNLTVTAICKMLKEKADIPVKDLFFSHNLLQEFIKYYPRYPLVKILIRPNHAYIAPVENMYHDGSTFGMSSLDVHMMLRGHFSVFKK